MEAFSLLKYWRGGGGVSTRDSHSNPRPTAFPSSSSAGTTTTIVTAVSPSSSDSDSDDGDDGPFFDLEFALPEDDSDSDSEEDQTKEPPNVEELENENSDENEEEVAEDEEEEIKFTLSPSSSGDAADSTDPNVTLSPSDDLFFKGHLLPIDSSSMILNASEVLPKFPVSSILKSATKLRVQMMKFNKSKSNLREKSSKSEPKSPQKSENDKNESQERRRQSKFFTVKLKVEEVPLVSLFTRDTSSKGANSKSIRQDVNTDEESTDSSCNGDEKKFSKEYVMQKYFKKVKPLYIRVSKRYGDKLRFSGHLSIPKCGAPAPPQPPPSTAEVKAPPEKSTIVKAGGAEGAEGAEVAAVSNVKSQKQGNLQAGLRVVCKHLGKSRSASSSAPAPAVPVVSKRRDDSLLQQQDGIQSAILHCKRSFNASRDMEASILSRSVSDPSHEKSVT